MQVVKLLFYCNIIKLGAVMHKKIFIYSSVLMVACIGGWFFLSKNDAQEVSVEKKIVNFIAPAKVELSSKKSIKTAVVTSAPVATPNTHQGAIIPPSQDGLSVPTSAEFSLTVNSVADDGSFDYTGLDTGLIKKGGVLFENNLSGLYALNPGDKLRINLLGMELSGWIQDSEKTIQDGKEKHLTVMELSPPQVGALILTKMSENNESYEAGELLLNGFTYRITTNAKVGIFIAKSQLGPHKRT